MTQLARIVPDSYVPTVESPIERAMFSALQKVGAEEFDFDILFFTDESRRLGIPVRILLQYPIGDYRADFVVRCTYDDKRKLRIVVECDGHDFHERTKEQASHDKRRDRLFQRLGYQVFRFTGSDITKDANGCAREVMQTVMDWFSAQANESMGAA